MKSQCCAGSSRIELISLVLDLVRLNVGSVNDLYHKTYPSMLEGVLFMIILRLIRIC